jgi:hypothetical protein
MATDARVLLQPTGSELNDALNQATKTANHHSKTLLLSSPLAGQERFLREMEAQPEGWRQWNGGEGRALGGGNHSIVYVGWWTDYGGRRHVLVGGQRFPRSYASLAHCLTARPEPPLALIYPQHVLFRTLRGQRELLACCDCGVYGAPEAIGWMGTCCGPCHDRREAGSTPRPHGAAPGCIQAAHESGVDVLAFSPDGDTLASSGWDNDLRLWDVKTGEALRVLPSEGGPARVRTLTFSPDGSTLVSSGTPDEGYTFWDLRKARAWGRVPADHLCDYLRYTADGRVLAAVFGMARSFWLVTPGRCEPALREEAVPGFWWVGFDLAPDGRALAIASANTVHVWDVATRTPQAPFTIGTDPIHSLAYSPDGALLALGTRAKKRGEVLLWDIAARRVRGRLAVPPVWVVALRFSPDGRTLIARGEASIQALDAGTGTARALLEWPDTFAPCDIQFAPDGRSFATAHKGGTIRFWPIELLGQG